MRPIHIFLVIFFYFVFVLDVFGAEADLRIGKRVYICKDLLLRGAINNYCIEDYRLDLIQKIAEEKNIYPADLLATCASESQERVEDWIIVCGDYPNIGHNPNEKSGGSFQINTYFHKNFPVHNFDKSLEFTANRFIATGYKKHCQYCRYWSLVRHLGANSKAQIEGAKRIRLSRWIHFNTPLFNEYN